MSNLGRLALLPLLQPLAQRLDLADEAVVAGLQLVAAQGWRGGLVAAHSHSMVAGGLLLTS